MCAKKAKTTKKKIVSAAWKLFYEQGYDNTTVDDIVEESGTSKGSFYHYFEGAWTRRCTVWISSCISTGSCSA